MSIPRKVSSADVYHVIARGTGRQTIFECDDDRNTYLRILSSARSKTGAELYAWCLMSNHVHLVMHAPLSTVSVLMRIVHSTYAHYFNERTGRTGHLFQERFRSEAVNDDAYLMTVVRYVHANPEKAHITRLDCYPWSSYKEYMGEPGICKTDFVLEIFRGRRSFQVFHQEPIEEDTCLDVDRPRNATRPMPDDLARSIAQSVLGDTRLNDLKSLPAELRDPKLASLKHGGLSIRQIERLTGIGRGSIQRA